MSCKYGQVGCKSRVLGPGWWQLSHQVWPSCRPNRIFWSCAQGFWGLSLGGVGLRLQRDQDGGPRILYCGLVWPGWSVPSGKQAYFPGSAWASLCCFPHSQQHCRRGTSWYLGPLSFFQFGSHFCSTVELPLLVPFLIHTFNFSLFIFCVLLWG